MSFRTWAIMTAIIAAAGCQSYTPRPLDHDAHLAEWRSRSVSSEAVSEFAAALQRDGRPSELNVADGLSLAEAEIVAMAYNPDLREARARAAVALAGAEFAGLWDDPVIQGDVLHIIESVPNPWVIGAAVGFTIPISGRLDVEKKLAKAEHQVALREVINREWEITAEIRAAWLAWSAARLQADLNAQLIEQIDGILPIVDRLEQARELSRLESRLYLLERGSREADRIRLEAQARRLELACKSLMGLVPEAAVNMQPAVTLDGIGGDASAAMRDRFERYNTFLAVKRAEFDAAEHALHREIRRQYPDLALGPAFERDQDQSRIGFNFGIPIPILNANRRGIAEANARRDEARFAFEAAFERLSSVLAQAEVDWQASRAAREHVEQTLVPLADEQLADQRTLSAKGELDTFITLETFVRAQDTKVQLIDARLAESLALNRIAELTGPQRPDSRGPGGGQP